MKLNDKINIDSNLVFADAAKALKANDCLECTIECTKIKRQKCNEDIWNLLKKIYNALLEKIDKNKIDKNEN